MISELLGMPLGFISDNSGITAPRTMRLLHYPANETPADDTNVGISAHTDFECFTIMNQTAAGLELTDTRGQWCLSSALSGPLAAGVRASLRRYAVASENQTHFV